MGVDIRMASSRLFSCNGYVLVYGLDREAPTLHDSITIQLAPTPNALKIPNAAINLYVRRLKSHSGKTLGKTKALQANC